MIRKAGATTQKTAILLLLSLIACSAPKNSATAKIINPQTGNVLGEAKFIDTKKGVLFKIELQAKNSATLGVHIHEYGDCSYLEAKNAGGHWNPSKETHGTWGGESFHSGDIGNIKTDKNGKGSLEVLDVFGRWSLGGEKITSVLNKSIIVHEGRDDMTTQPSGAAGKRIGCGVIKNIK